MPSTQLQLTRAQLEKFLPDQRAIKAFEELMTLAGEVLPEASDEVLIDTGSNTATINSALDLIASINETLALLDTAPSVEATLLSQLASLEEKLDLIATAPAVATNLPVTTDYIQFNTEALDPDPVKGHLHWDGFSTLHFEMNDTVDQKIGLNTFIYGKASAAITKGQVIIHTGAVGASGVMTIAPAPAALLEAHDILGVATEDLALNDFGFVSATGDLRGFDTTGTPYGEVWADGDELWYNPAYVGGLTNVKPAAPNQKTHIGVVINAAGGGAGSIDIHLVRSVSIDEGIQDVGITAVADNDVLQYSTSLGYWENVAASSLTVGNVTNALTNGSYITSSGTYDGSVARTFAVDATTTNTASKVVARDGSGDFAAGRITAAGLTSTETIIPHTTKGIVGTTTNDSAQAGSVGELVTAGSGATALTSGVYANLTSISLTAGDWEVSATVAFAPAPTTVFSQVLGTTANTSAALGGFGEYFSLNTVTTAGAGSIFSTPTSAKSLASTTTIYLNVYAAFITSTATATGLIRARRIR